MGLLDQKLTQDQIKNDALELVKNDALQQLEQERQKKQELELDFKKIISRLQTSF